MSSSSAVTAASSFTNASDGRFVVDGRYVSSGGGQGRTIGFFAPAQIVGFRNDGQFEVHAVAGTAYGHLSAGPLNSPRLVNTGTMLVTGGYRAIGFSGAVSGQFDNSGTLTVQGAMFAEGIHWANGSSSTFSNTGRIMVATDPTSPNASIGLFQGETVSASIIRNSGVIDADIAIMISDGQTNYRLGDTLINSGQVRGNVMLGFGDDSVENSGLMTGRTLLGGGDDRYDGSGGRHDGSVEGGPGADRLTGGGGTDTLFGDGGDDRIAGAGGDDYVDGGWGSDRLDGGAGFDTLSYAASLAAVTVDLATGIAFDGGAYDRVSRFEGVVGSRYDDVLAGSGDADSLRGLDGDDRIDGGAGNDILRGDGGADRLTGGAGVDRFIYQVGDGADVITDFQPGERVAVYGYPFAESVTQSGTSVVLTLFGTDRLTFLNATAADVRAAVSFTAQPLARRSRSRTSGLSRSTNNSSSGAARPSSWSIPIRSSRRTARFRRACCWRPAAGCRGCSSRARWR